MLYLLNAIDFPEGEEPICVKNTFDGRSFPIYTKTAIEWMTNHTMAVVALNINAQKLDFDKRLYAANKAAEM